jgi:hypothetical protein
VDVQTSNPCRHRSTCAKEPWPVAAAQRASRQKIAAVRHIQVLVPDLKAACHSPRIGIDIDIDSDIDIDLSFDG